MIYALLLSLYERANKLSNEWSILELVPTRTTRHEEPTQARLVVQRNPVIGDVVQRTNAEQFEGDSKIWQAARKSQHHSLKKLHGDRIIPVVCIVNEMQFIASWLGSAHIE